MVHQLDNGWRGADRKYYATAEEAHKSFNPAVLARASDIVSLRLSSIIIPERKLAEGNLIKAHWAIWSGIVDQLSADWNLAYTIPPTKWEEIIAGAFDLAGFDEVILTPRSGDHGRDVIATRNGVGSIKILGSVKAYQPGHLVEYDHIRSLLGVLSGDRSASKGIIATTSDFPPLLVNDPFIAPFLPTRLELLNGRDLIAWLEGLKTP